MSEEFNHISVLLDESVELLRVKPGGIYADGTLGGGGHSEKILQKLQGGLLIGIDRDAVAINAAAKRLEKYKDRVKIVHDNSANIKSILKSLDIPGLSGAILDLGVSSPQLDDAERGFSYSKEARLDMRMNREDKLSAYEVVNEYPEEKLAKIIFEYGEERFARQIAREIVKRRALAPIETTTALAELIKHVAAQRGRYADKHPAKRTFQAIRIEVNRELELLEGTIRDFVDCLEVGGVLAVITFHSLEDRIVKQTFSSLAEGCVCPREFPVCVCGRKPQVRLVNKKPIVSASSELEENFRAHSAKLRAVEKL